MLGFFDKNNVKISSAEMALIKHPAPDLLPEEASKKLATLLDQYSQNRTDIDLLLKAGALIEKKRVPHLLTALPEPLDVFNHNYLSLFTGHFMFHLIMQSTLSGSKVLPFYSKIVKKGLDNITDAETRSLYSLLEVKKCEQSNSIYAMQHALIAHAEEKCGYVAEVQKGYCPPELSQDMPAALSSNSSYPHGSEPRITESRSPCCAVL